MWSQHHLSKPVCTLIAFLGFLSLPEIGNVASPASGTQEDGNLTPPVAISAPQPASAAPVGRFVYKGTLVLEIEIDAHGDVGRVRIVKRLPIQSLQEKAIATIQTWKFRPATRDRVPVPFHTLVRIDFKLTQYPNYKVSCPVPFAVGTTQSGDPAKLTWEDFPDEISRWLAQRKSQATFSRLCQAAPPDSK